MFWLYLWCPLFNSVFVNLINCFPKELTRHKQRIYVNLKKIDVSDIQYFVILNITYYLFVNYSKLDGHVSSAVKDDVILRSTESFLDLVTLFHTQ